MKKNRIVYLFLLFVLLCSCSQKTENHIQNDVRVEEESITYDALDEDEIEDGFFNKNDEDKNLFLKFLNDEIPVKDYYEIGKDAYYSEITDNDLIPDDESFFIVDMDGDGNNEFVYFVQSMLEIIEYNQKSECFELWLSVKSQQRPIGNGEMYAVITSQPIIYEFYVYNENAELIDSKYYRTGEEYIEGSVSAIIIYEIDGNRVTEEEWLEESNYFFEQKASAPESISYLELYE